MNRCATQRRTNLPDSVPNPGQSPRQVTKWIGDSYVSDVTTMPAYSQDLNFLAEVFLTSMRDAITADRGYWDVGKEDAQFRQQLDFSATHVIQVDNRDVGFIMTRRLGDRVVE